MCPSTDNHYLHEYFKGIAVLLTQKKITYAEQFVGKFISRNITYSFVLIWPGSELISEICDFQRLEHGPKELHIWPQGNLFSAKCAKKNYISDRPAN